MVFECGGIGVRLRKDAAVACNDGDPEFRFGAEMPGELLQGGRLQRVGIGIQKMYDRIAELLEVFFGLPVGGLPQRCKSHNGERRDGKEEHAARCREKVYPGFFFRAARDHSVSFMR